MGKVIDMFTRQEITETEAPTVRDGERLIEALFEIPIQQGDVGTPFARLISQVMTMVETRTGADAMEVLDIMHKKASR